MNNNERYIVKVYNKVERELNWKEEAQGKTSGNDINIAMSRNVKMSNHDNWYHFEKLSNMI